MALSFSGFSLAWSFSGFTIRIKKEKLIFDSYNYAIIATSDDLIAV